MTPDIHPDPHAYTTPDTTPDTSPDPLDRQMHALFAAVHPAADFEDRLINAVRRRNRFAIPAPVRRAAIAAAAVLMVGTAGYVGNRAINGGMHFGQQWKSAVPASRPSDYEIQTGDLLNITLNDVTGGGSEITKQIRVDSDGFISLAAVGKIRAAGLSEDKLQKAIAASYKNNQIGEVLATIYTLESRDRSRKTSKPDIDGFDLEKNNDIRSFKNSVLDNKAMDALAIPQRTELIRRRDSDGFSKVDLKNNGIEDQQVFINLGKHDAVPRDFAFENIGNGKKQATKASPAGDATGGFEKPTVRAYVGGSPYDNLDSVLLPKRDAAGVADPLARTVTVQNPSRFSPVPHGENEKTPRYSTGGASGNDSGSSRSLDWISSVGNGAVPGSVGGQDQPARTGPAGSDGRSNMLNINSANASTLRALPGNNGATRSQSKGQSTGSGPAGGDYFREKESVVGGMVQDARDYTEGGKYIEALAVIDSIKRLDPNNAYANGVSQVLEYRAREQGNTTQQFGAEFNKQLNQAPEKQMPSSELRGDIPTLPAVVLQPGNNGQAAPVAAVGAPVQAAAPVDDRKIIRTGTMEFDVDRFDTAQMQITKIVGELGGFVGATDSTKLPNGKVRGSISVRVPPERLDTLVLSLRALGDLKSQQIIAADITKQYTDLQSELAADRAMQDRLLELIHDGKGSVKDLLAAENELGEWRTKIEKAEGMIRYYNGQVALSTLSITMTERDIHTPATAIETETADVGIEADDVEKARNSAMKAIDEVKGRIIEAELKRFDAGQLAAKLVADVPPEAAGAVIDQLKLLGKVARLEVHRQQQSSDGTGEGGRESGGAPGAASGSTVTSNTPLRTERKPTRLLISIYNLANVAPRRTTVVSVAATDVETAYAALMTATKTNGGRVVTSTLDRGDPIKATASLVLELPPEKLDLAMTTLHAQGDVLNLSLTENPDTQNSTEAKQGLTVKLISLANVAPRRTTNTSVAANDVDGAYTAIIAAVKSNGGRVVSSTLDRGDPAKATGSLILEIPPDKLSAALATLHAQGDVLNMNQAENPDTQNSTESKAGLTVKLFSMAAVSARESIDQTIAAVDVPASYQAILSAAATTHSRVATAALKEQDQQNITADLELDIPRVTASEMDKAIAGAGGTISRTATRAADNDGTVDSKVHLKLSISSADHLPAREKTALQMEVADVDKAAASAQAAAITAGGRVLKSTVFKDQGKDTSAVLLDFPLDKYSELLQQVRNQGTVRGIDASRDPQAPTGSMAHAQIYVEFRTGDTIVADQTGPWASVRSGLSTSINGLLWSLRWVVVGLCLIGPWAVIVWIGWKLKSRMRATKPDSLAGN